MSKKSAKIAALIEDCRGLALDAHYLGYFECFNRTLFYEAHDVLEELWLADRNGPNAGFYKGLIQLAGAFVHLQKNRLRPAAALYQLARANFQRYPVQHESLDLGGVILMIDEWLRKLEAGAHSENPYSARNAPRLELSWS